MITKEHLIQTFKLWGFIIEELEKTKIFLQYENINDPFYRRLLLRNIFSIIETYLFVTREIIKIKIDFDGKNAQVPWWELAILNEQKTALDDQGNAKTLDDFQKFIPSLKFTLNLFAKIFDSEFPKYGDNNFEKLVKLSKRRNDVTHPKSLDQLLISDQEIKDIISMFGWFVQTHNSVSLNFLKWLNNNYGNGMLQ